MAVKFVRTCDRCGKVIREGSANSTLTVGEGNSLNFYTKDEHKSYDICDECAEAFERFMTGWVSLRDVLSEDKCDLPVLYNSIDQFGRGVITKEGLEHLKTTVEETKNDGPSEEVLALMREHNAKCDAMEAETNKDGPIYKYVSSFASKVSDSKITVERDDEQHNEKHEIKLKPGTHTYHIWTKEEDDFILHHSMGMTAAQLAYKFGATVPAVKARKWMLATGKIRSKE